MPSKLIVVLGPTATGKTKLAAHLAAQIDGEVMSADSRQVYRGMDIGTGKDLGDFVVKDKNIPYHLIDIIDAGEEYNVFEFQKHFLDVYETILQRKKYPILCGGTGMYLESVLKGYRFLQIPEDTELRKALKQKPTEELITDLRELKELHNTTDTTNRNRLVRAIEIARFQQKNEALIRDFPEIDYKIFGIYFEREVIRQRITQRLKYRLEQQGMIEEVKILMTNGVPPEKLKFYGLEYKIITQYLLGEFSYNDMFQKLNSSIHQFAKRQTTWFRKMERDGFEINWIDGNLELDEKVKWVLERV